MKSPRTTYTFHNTSELPALSPDIAAFSGPLRQECPRSGVLRSIYVGDYYTETAMLEDDVLVGRLPGTL